MALFFGKKKDESTTPPATGGGGSNNRGIGKVGGGTDDGGDAPFSPEKANRFFSHAKTVQETGNYEYAISSWLSGMKLDPTSKVGIEGFFGSIASYLAETGGKKSVSKDVEKIVGGKNDVERYLASLLEWGQRPTEQTLAVRSMELAARLNLTDPVRWIGERAFAITVRNPKPRKDLILKVSEAFEKIQVLDLAIRAAEKALEIDKTDGDLAAKIRNLAAQSAVNRGGYDNAGKDGGFRQNIRDLDKQRILDAADRITKTSETVETLVSAAEKDYEARPNDLYAIEKYSKILLERGNVEDENKAHEILMKAFGEQKQFRFREIAGEIRLRQARRRVGEAKRALEGQSADQAAKDAHETALDAQRALEVEEYLIRVEAYPTDLARKFELGKAYFQVNRFEDAIGMLQKSQEELRHRAQSLSYLGQAFLKLEWASEAVDTFRAALEGRDLSPETQLELQYYLMCALQSKAEAERQLPVAEEAERLASSIAIKNIMFRDIRNRRESIKKLVQTLRSGAPA